MKGCQHFKFIVLGSDKGTSTLPSFQMVSHENSWLVVGARAHFDGDSKADRRLRRSSAVGGPPY